MVTIKSYTDIEQSKKLAEILPLESADMYWDYDVQKHEYYPMVMDKQFDDTCVRAWSLAALLSVLPDYTLQTNTDGTVFVVCESKKPMISDAYNNPIDACYELILKLHEFNLLRLWTTKKSMR